MSEKMVRTLKPHISLNVRNIAESVGFYQKLFGIEPMKFIKGDKVTQPVPKEESNHEPPRSQFGYAKFDVEFPPLNFVLNEVPFTKGGSLSHLGLQVATTDDVLRTRDRWIESGLITVDQMKVDCCYALQDKTWARDPDGNEWEVFTVLEDTEPTGNGCGCGDRVEHAELSTAECCTSGQKATTIGATNQPCC